MDGKTKAVTDVVAHNNGIGVVENRQTGLEAEVCGTATSSTVVILSSGSHTSNDPTSSHLPASINSTRHLSRSTFLGFRMAGINVAIGMTSGIVEMTSVTDGTMRGSVNAKRIKSGKSRLASENRNSVSENEKRLRSSVSGSENAIEDAGNLPGWFMSRRCVISPISQRLF